MTYVEGHGVKDEHVLHWVREADAELAEVVDPTAICGRPVKLGSPSAPSRPCMNCTRRKAARENRSRHRASAYRALV